MPACLIGIAVCKRSQQSRLRSRNSFTLDYSVGVYAHALFAVGPHIVRHSILEVCGIRVIVHVERVFLGHICSCRAKKNKIKLEVLAVNGPRSGCSHLKR